MPTAPASPAPTIALGREAPAEEEEDDAWLPPELEALGPPMVV